MTWSRLLLLSSVVVAGCSDAPDRLLPGPCSATRSFEDDGDAVTITATYSYDDAGRLARVEQPTVVVGIRYYTGATTTYTRDDVGAIVTIATATPPGELDSETASWTFTETSVSYAYRYSDFTRVEAEHEVGLRFRGDPLELDAAISPSSPDSVLHEIVTDVDLGESSEYTYTYDGPPLQGTRTQTSSSGNVRTFTYDSDGNLLEAASGAGTTTYVWEAGLLAEIVYSQGTHTVYTRDRFGNLLEVTRDADEPVVTTYDYGCW